MIRDKPVNSSASQSTYAWSNQRQAGWQKGIKYTYLSKSLGFEVSCAADCRCRYFHIVQMGARKIWGHYQQKKSGCTNHSETHQLYCKCTIKHPRPRPPIGERLWLRNGILALCAGVPAVLYVRLWHLQIKEWNRLRIRLGRILSWPLEELLP